MEQWIEASFPGAERAALDDEPIALEELRAMCVSSTVRAQDEDSLCATLWVDGALLLHCIPGLAHALMMSAEPAHLFHGCRLSLRFTNLPQALHVARFRELVVDGRAACVRGQVMEKACGKLILVDFERPVRNISRRLSVTAEDDALLEPWALGAGVVIIGRPVFGMNTNFVAHHVRPAPRVYPARFFPSAAVAVDLGGPAASALCLSALVAHSGLSPFHVLLYGDVLSESGEDVVRAACKWSPNTVWCADSRNALLSTRKSGGVELGAALALASDGVAVLVDATQMTRRVAERLSDELSGQHCSTTCWALWPKAGLTRESQMTALQELRPLFPGLLAAFALHFRILSPDDALPAVSAEHLHRATSILARNDMEISDDARALLEGFVIRSRQIRNTRSQEMPISALGVAISLAQAHAALCFRGKVHSSDAVVALWLLEESLVSSTGRSVIQFSRALPRGKSNLSMYAGLGDLGHHLRRFALSMEQ